MVNLLTVWILSIIGTVFFAGNKNRNRIGWFFLGLYLGPVALIIVLILPAINKNKLATSEENLGSSLESIKDELERIKAEFSSLSNRINRLGSRISLLETGEQKESLKEPVIEQAAAMPRIEEAQPATTAIKPQVRRPDIEMDLGRFWLNKIGMIVFALGIAFLLTYTITRFGPVAKILFGYLIAVALFIVGLKLENKEKYINYGRVLLGGSWAIAYFTTYAMYHFEASKVINSQLLELVLLALVALGIIAHSLKYKSQALTAIALFIGYFTSVLGDVGYFTLVSAGLLAIVALIIIYKMQWVRFVFLGVILTYLTHLVWVLKQISYSLVPVGPLNVENVYFHFDSGFLLIYWGLFALATHLIKNNTDESLSKKLAAANFANFILFFFMVYPKFHFFYPDYKFNAVLGLGLVYLALAAVMELFKRNEFFISDVTIAVSLLTLSVPLKFLPYHTTVIWFIELPFLLFVGFIFNRRIYRYLAFVLSFILFFKLITYDYVLPGNIFILNLKMSWQGFLTLLGFISSAVCFSLHHFLGSEEGGWLPDNLAKRIYSGFSVIYLTMFVFDIVKPLWLTLGISLESLLVFTVGAMLLDKYIRWYALVVLFLSGMRFCFYDRYANVNELWQTLLVCGPVACAFVEYVIYRRLSKKSLILKPEMWSSKALFFAASSLLVFAIVVYVQQVWITLSIAVVSLFTLHWGIKIEDRPIRIYSLLILLGVAVRFLFVDSYHDFSKLFQWSLIATKLACVYLAYFLYRALDKKLQLDEIEKPLVSVLFYFSSFLVVCTIFQQIKDIWISASLGIAGVVFFATGFLIKEKIFRHGGFIIFGITLLRVAFVDLAGLPIIYKIISFTVLGILFLGVSFIYTKFSAEKLSQKQ